MDTIQRIAILFAASGETVVVTFYKKPVAEIKPTKQSLEPSLSSEQELVFAYFDHKLCNAASQLGLTLLNYQ